LVEDVFRRSLGREIAIVDSPVMWASEVARLLERQDRAAHEPEVDLIVAGGDGAETAGAVTAYLQLPLHSVRTLPDLAAEALLSHRDKVLLAYDAVGVGDRESAVAIFRADACVCQRNRPDRAALAVVDEVIGREIVLQVDELVSTDDAVGVVGWATARDPRRADIATYAFSHLLRFAGGRVAELEIVECRREGREAGLGE
jgi:hypothetical protein